MQSTCAALASDIVRNTGAICIHLRPAADQRTAVTIRSVEALRLPGRRLWLRSRRQAERLLKELFGYRDVTRSRVGLVAQATLDTIDARLRQLAALNGFPCSEDDEIAATLGNFELRIKAALQSGLAKQLSRQYRAAREAGEPVPAYPAWVGERLRAELIRF